jgi:hypothetical protein
VIKYKVERWPLRTHEFSYKNFLLLQSVYPEWSLTYEQYYDFCKYDGHDPCSAEDHSDCREMRQDIYCRDNPLEKEYQPIQYVDRWVGKSEFLNSLLLDRVIRKKLGVELPRKNKKR